MDRRQMMVGTAALVIAPDVLQASCTAPVKKKFTFDGEGDYLSLPVVGLDENKDFTLELCISQGKVIWMRTV